MTTEIEIGSTNVYADLGYTDETEMQCKAGLAAKIARGIETRQLTESAAALLFLTSNQPQQLECVVDFAVRRYKQREPSGKRWFACRSGDETGTGPPRGSDGSTWRT